MTNRGATDLKALFTRLLRIASGRGYPQSFNSHNARLSAVTSACVQLRALLSQTCVQWLWRGLLISLQGSGFVAVHSRGRLGRASGTGWGCCPLGAVVRGSR